MESRTADLEKYALASATEQPRGFGAGADDSCRRTRTGPGPGLGSSRGRRGRGQVVTLPGLAVARRV